MNFIIIKKYHKFLICIFYFNELRTKLSNSILLLFLYTGRNLSISFLNHYDSFLSSDSFINLNQQRNCLTTHS